MSQINIQHLTFAYDGSYDNIFEDVSFQLDTDWKLGLIGRNGRGKTTLLRLLLGEYEYRGVITASVEFEYFPFPVEDPEADALQVAEQACGEQPYWKLVREMNLLELSEDVLYRPFFTLSNGEQTKLLLAALFLRENSFLLIDEPTNHLDIRGREVVSQYLNRKKGFILVSHDRTFLDGCVDHILSLNRAGIEVQQGNFSSWMQNRAYQDQFEMAENEKLKSQIAHLQKSAKEKAAWSHRVESTKYDTRNSGLRADRGYVGHQAAKMMKRSKAIQQRLETAAEEKAKLLKNVEEVEDLRLTQPAYHTARFIQLREVSIQYGDKTVCRDVNFTIERGDRIALTGKNGSGKSSLLRLICGEEVPFSGTLERGSRMTISYVPQNSSFLRGSLREFAQENGIDESLFKAILRKLDFSRPQLEKEMESFSQGQKKKVLLAKSLCQQAHLLVWDEPLNYIDVLSRMQIEKLLLTWKPTILFVEHDRAFCQAVATKEVRL